MFTDVKVPKANRIGDDGFGFTFAMTTLNGGRIGIASQALGIAAGAYELAVKYAKERKAFGKTLSEHQAIQFKLAEMATKNRCCPPAGSSGRLAKRPETRLCTGRRHGQTVCL